MKQLWRIFLISLFLGITQVSLAAYEDKYVPSLHPIPQAGSLPDSVIFETPKRHKFDQLEVLQNSSTVQKALSVYNRYLKIFDLSQAQEGTIQVKIEVAL